MTDEGTFELANCTKMLIGEIADHSLYHRDIAQTYALAMRSSETVDWATVNRAIVDRWTRSALEWIKYQAHSGKCFDEPRGRAPRDGRHNHKGKTYPRTDHKDAMLDEHEAINNRLCARIVELAAMVDMMKDVNAAQAAEIVTLTAEVERYRKWGMRWA